MSTLSNAEYLRRLKQGGVGYNTNSSNFDAYLNNQMLQNSDYRDYLQQSLTNANNQPKLYSKDTQETLDKANKTLEESKSFLNDLGRFEYNFTKGFFNFFEGVGDFAIGLAGGIGKIFGADDQWAQDAINFDWSSRAALLSQNFQINNMLGKAFQGINPFDAQEWDMSDEGVQRILDRYNNQGVAKDILPEWLVNGVDELASTVGQMLPSIALGGYVGTTGKALGWTQKAINFGSKLASVGAMSLSAAGNATGEALQETDDLGSALAYGAASGTVEGVSEYVFGWLTKGAGAAMTKMNLDGSKLANLLPNSVSGWFGKEVSKNFAVQISKEFIEEGAEEVFSDLMNPLIKSIYNGKSVSENYEELDPQELLHSFVMGGMTTLVMGGANIATDINLGKNGREAKGYLNDGMNAYYEMQELVKNNKATTLDAEGNTVASPKMIELQNKITNAKLQLENVYSKMSPTELGKFYKNVTGENLNKRYTKDINEVKEGIKNIDNQIQVATEANPNAVEPLENLKKTLIERQSFLEKGQDNYINSYSNSLIDSSFKNLTKENAIYDVKTANHEKALKKYVRSLSEKSKVKLETARNEYIKSINDMVKNPSDFDIKTIANNLYEVSNELADDFDNYDAAKLVTDYLDSINTLKKDVNKYVFNAIITKSKMSSKVVYASGDSLESKDIKGFYLPNDNTIVINSDYINESPEIFAHEFFGHAIGKSISSDQLNNLYSKISLTKWYRENIDNILKEPRYNELYTKNKAKFKEEILANYLSGLFDNSDNYKQNLRVLRGLFLNKDFYKPFSQFIKSDFSKSILKNDRVFNNFITVLNDLLGEREAKNIFFKYTAGLSGIMNNAEKTFYESNKEAINTIGESVLYSVDLDIAKEVENLKTQKESLEEVLSELGTDESAFAEQATELNKTLEQINERIAKLEEALKNQEVKQQTNLKIKYFEDVFEMKNNEPVKNKDGSYKLKDEVKALMTNKSESEVKIFGEKIKDLIQERANYEITLNNVSRDPKALELFKKCISLTTEELFEHDKNGQVKMSNGSPVFSQNFINGLLNEVRTDDDPNILEALQKRINYLKDHIDKNVEEQKEIQKIEEKPIEPKEVVLEEKHEQVKLEITEKQKSEFAKLQSEIKQAYDEFSNLKIDNQSVREYCESIQNDLDIGVYDSVTAEKVKNLYDIIDTKIDTLETLNMHFQTIADSSFDLASAEISASQSTEILKKMNQLRFIMLNQIEKPAFEVFRSVYKLNNVTDAEGTSDMNLYDDALSDYGSEYSTNSLAESMLDFEELIEKFRFNVRFLSGIKDGDVKKSFFSELSKKRKEGTGTPFKITEDFKKAKSINSGKLLKKTGFLKAGENRTVFYKEVSAESFKKVFNDKTNLSIRYLGKDTGKYPNHYLFITDTNSEGKENGSGFSYYYKPAKDYQFGNTIVINKIFSQGDNNAIYKNIGVFLQHEAFRKKGEKLGAAIISIEIPETNMQVAITKNFADFDIIPAQRLFLEGDKVPSYIVFSFAPSNTKSPNLNKIPTYEYADLSRRHLKRDDTPVMRKIQKTIFTIEKFAISSSRKNLNEYKKYFENQKEERIRKSKERYEKFMRDKGITLDGNKIIISDNTVKKVQIKGTYTEDDVKKIKKETTEKLKQKQKANEIKKKETAKKQKKYKEKMEAQEKKTKKINSLIFSSRNSLNKALKPLHFAFLDSEPLKNLLDIYVSLEVKYPHLTKQVGGEYSLKQISQIISNNKDLSKNFLDLDYVNAMLEKTRLIVAADDLSQSNFTIQSDFINDQFDKYIESKKEELIKADYQISEINQAKEFSDSVKNADYVFTDTSRDYFANAMQTIYSSSTNPVALEDTAYNAHIIKVTDGCVFNAPKLINIFSAQYRIPPLVQYNDIAKASELGGDVIDNLNNNQVSDYVSKLVPNENKGDTTAIDLTSKQSTEVVEKEPWRKKANNKDDSFKVKMSNSVYNIKNADGMAMAQVLLTNKDTDYERGLQATGAFTYDEACAASYERRRSKNIANYGIQEGVLKYNNFGNPVKDSDGNQMRCEPLINAEVIMDELAGESKTKNFFDKFKKKNKFSSKQENVRRTVYLYGDLMRQLDINNYYMECANDVFLNFFELPKEAEERVRKESIGQTELEIKAKLADETLAYNERLLKNTLEYFKNAIKDKKSFNLIDYKTALKTDEIAILNELGTDKEKIKEIKESLENALDNITIKNVFGESCEKEYFYKTEQFKAIEKYLANIDDFKNKLAQISPSKTDFFLEDFDKAFEESIDNEKIDGLHVEGQEKELRAYKHALKEVRALFNTPSNDRINSTINSLYDIVPKDKMDHIWNIFWDNLKNARNALVHYGRLSPREASLFDRVYPHYVPLKRLKISGIADSGRSTDIMNLIREFKGSNEVIAPLNNNIIDFIYSSQVVGVLNAQLNKAYQNGDFAKNNYITFSEDKTLPRFTNAFDLSAVEETFEPELGSNTLKFVHYDENGEKHIVNAEFGKYAYESITDSFYRMPVELRGLSKFGGLFRNAVTEWNPFFIARNMTRDLADALLTSKHGSVAFGREYLKSLYEIAKGDSHLFKLYLDNGGLISSMFAKETSYELSQQMLQYKKEQGKANKLNPFYWVSRANEIIEMTPRFTEFKLSFEKYVKEGMEESMAIKQAMYDAANVTTDFSRGGKAAKWLNRNLIPFLNAQIQGACKTVNIFLHPKDKKELAKLFAKILLWGLLPQLLNEILNWGNDDYEALPTYTKEQYWLIPLSNGTFIKIPKGHILGTFNTMFQNLIWTLKGDVNVGEGMKNTLESASSNVAPVDLGTGLRTIFSPISDIKNNTTWYGQSIDKQSDLNKRPSSRYDSDTSEISKAIGKLFNYSPKRINYLLEQYTGVVGDIILPLTAESGFKTGIGGSLSSFIESNTTISSVKNSKYRGEFYDLRQETLYDANDGSASSKIVYSYITRALKDINELEDQADSVVNSAEQYTAYLTVRQAYQSAINNAKALKESLDKMVLTEENSREEITEAYRQTFGAAEALKYYNKNAYSKATIGNKFGLTYDNYYQLYFLARSLSTKAEVKALVRNYVGNDTYKMCAVMKLLGVQLSDEEKAKAKSFLSKRVNKEDLELLKL